MTINEISAYVDSVMLMAKTNEIALQPHERVNLLITALSICGRPDSQERTHQRGPIPYDAKTA